MATIVLFHSALGLRPAVHAFADALRADGHHVVTPDLFDGEVFDELSEGVALRDALGIPELSRRACAAVAELPADIYYAGFSMGAASAQYLAATRAGARGALLMHGVLPPVALGLQRWPAVPLQVHLADGDEWTPAPVVDALVQACDPEVLQRFTYAGGHLFTDAASADFDASSAALLLERARGFVLQNR